MNKKILVFGLCLISLFGCTNKDVSSNKNLEEDCRTILYPIVSGKLTTLIPMKVCD